MAPKIKNMIQVSPLQVLGTHPVMSYRLETSPGVQVGWLVVVTNNAVPGETLGFPMNTEHWRWDVGAPWPSVFYATPTARAAWVGNVLTWQVFAGGTATEPAYQAGAWVEIPFTELATYTGTMPTGGALYRVRRHTFGTNSWSDVAWMHQDGTDQTWWAPQGSLAKVVKVEDNQTLRFAVP